jgi:cell division protein FtsL
MTKQQLRIFTASIFVAFSLLYAIVAGRAGGNEASALEDRINDQEGEIENLRSQVEELESVLERISIFVP